MLTITPDEFLGPNGRIAARLPQYDMRPEQLEMANAIHAAIQSREHIIAEAGTGVGKSFAYLVPAIMAVCQDQIEGRAPLQPRSDDDDDDESDAEDNDHRIRRVVI